MDAEPKDEPIDVIATGPLSRADAMALQEVELQRTLALLQSFDDADWRTPTECPGWDVRTMYLHVLGACEGAAVGENVRQLRAAWSRRRREGGPLEAALSAVQIDARRDLAPAELLVRFEQACRSTVRRRRAVPGLVRRVSIPVDGPVVERWRLGYLIDTIYLRDLWMHRIDVCRATGRPVELTADHDGRIVADVVAELARRHGGSFALRLSGPAGGVFVARPDGADAGVDRTITLDAVELCRTLAGRVPGEGLLATVVPF